MNKLTSHDDIVRNITPVILTYNEEANLLRTLSSVSWAKRIVVVDSGSTDGTERIVQSFSNTSWHVRQFDTHSNQWAFAIRDTGIDTDWVLALDADMIVPAAFLEEIANGFALRSFDAGLVPFRMMLGNRLLLGSVYPPQVRFFNPREIRIEQRGHTQVFVAEGRIYRFQTRLTHDDRKPLDRWLRSQLNYARLESDRISSSGVRSVRDWLRILGVMPLLIGGISYLRAGGPLGGAPAMMYALERSIFESILAIRLLDRRCQSKGEMVSEI